MENVASVERRLIATLAVIACTAVVGVLAILPYRLYQRDILQASTNAHRVSSIVHTVLSHALARHEEDDAVLRDLINRLQGIAGIEIRLRQLEEGEVHPAASSGRGSSTRDDTDLTYLSPPIVDRAGNSWLASMQFDLGPMKERSVRLITDLVLATILGSVVFSFVIYWLIRRMLVKPIQKVTREIGRIADAAEAGAEVRMPRFETREMRELAEVVTRACEARSAHA
jgi:hypothetical protein